MNFVVYVSFSILINGNNYDWFKTSGSSNKGIIFPYSFNIYADVLFGQIMKRKNLGLREELGKRGITCPIFFP